MVQALKNLLYEFIYNPSINRFLRAINKRLSFATDFRLPPSGIIRVQAGRDNSFRMATNQTSFVTRVLYYSGSEAFEYTTLFTKLIPKCNTFIDVGANTGYYSILAGKVSDATVYCFEPSPGPFHYLKKNIEINGLESRVHFFSLALGHQAGQLDFFAVKSDKYKNIQHHLGGVGSLNQRGQNNDIIKVDVTTFDEFMGARHSLNPVLIKVDTEGTEDMILTGAFRYIEKHHPIIICETLFNKIESRIETEMQKHGYLFFNYLGGSLHRTNTLMRSSDNGVRDCFMVHPDCLELVAEFIAK